jgi:carboxyl-terminal processing protease
MMEKNPKNQYLLPIGLAIAIAIGLGMGYYLAPRTNYTIAEQEGEKYQKIQDIIEILDKRYVDTVDGERLFEESIAGMLHKLDPHSNYIPSRDLKAAQESIQGNFKGVGVRFFIIRDTICITHVIPYSPSEKAGVMAGDKILKIDGDLVAGNGVTNEKVMDLLKGNANTEVKVRFKRNNDEVELKITRGSIPISSISSAYMINTTTGFVRIDAFSATTAIEFKTESLKLLQKGMKEMILDLRSNGGGVLSGAVDIADEFLEDGLEILKTKGTHTRNDVYTSKNGGLLESTKLSILINQYSASASEILAGAIQDNDRGLIYGRRSFGKGLVQGDFQLRDGSNLRLTVARYYTPSGRCIQKPYNGSMEDYYSDALDRVESGEMFAPDSSLRVDSLLYYTKSGRKVYGGGGIMPDVFIPFDTSFSNQYVNRLRYTPVFQTFAFDFVSDKREKWNNVESFNKQFVASEMIITAICKYAEKEYDIPFIQSEMTQNSKIIQQLLKQEIARQLWVENGFYYVTNKQDKEVLTLLKSKK